MKEFRDKVAVITGGASGIGYATAERSVKEGMKVVIADIEKAALAQTEKALRSRGSNILTVKADVSKAKDVETIAQKTLDAYGAVHLLFNNAGVTLPDKAIWERTLADWQWVMGVNLWGVIHGIRVFVPIMLRQNSECHIVNTASIAGLISGPGMGIYKVTKHGVVTLSETLYHDLMATGSKIRVSVLCPGLVNTRMSDSARNRPPELQNDPTKEKKISKEEKESRFKNERMISPDEVADRIFEAMINEKFYVLTHPETKEWIQMRMENILQERHPSNPAA
jgi:NAD(P)-dependent dehydrogenase (short-subunit alcohol dehydrogenase family)